MSRYVTHVRIVRKFRNPHLRTRWTLYLECGHDLTVTRGRRPVRKAIRCPQCERPIFGWVAKVSLERRHEEHSLQLIVHKARPTMTYEYDYVELVRRKAPTNASACA